MIRLPAALALIPLSVLGCTPKSSHVNEAEGTVTLAPERNWILKSDGLTEGPATLRVRLGTSIPIDGLEVRLGEKSVAATRGADGQMIAEIPVAELSAGRHALVAEIAGREVAKKEVTLTYPLYVVVSTDWDDSRLWESSRVPGNSSFDARRAFDNVFVRNMEAVHANHPDVKVTHFFGPYHFTDPALVSNERPGSTLMETRRAEIVAWLKGQRDRYGDEIGLHLHGWCHFVSKAGVRCLTSARDTFTGEDDRRFPGEEGLRGMLWNYSLDETRKILKYSIELFERNGLGRPTSFRAGGWTADAETLAALQETGFLVDSSAMKPDHIRHDWGRYPLHQRLTEVWHGISEMSQPYFPSRSDASVADPNGLAILEVPDNANLVDYMTRDQMVAVVEAHRLEKDASGRNVADFLSRPKAVVMGYHPPSYGLLWNGRDVPAELEGALDHIDGHLASRDLGPVRYVNMTDLARVWKR